MNTPLSEFYEPVRALLGDFNREVRRHEDSAIASVLRMLVRGGRLTGYALAVDRLSISPEVLAPDAWITLAYRAAITFILPESGSYSYRMRAVSESFGDRKHVLVALEQQLREVENGGADVVFGSWQSLSGWLAGQVPSRRDLWRQLVEVKAGQPPIGSLTLGGTDGGFGVPRLVFEP